MIIVVEDKEIEFRFRFLSGQLISFQFNEEYD